MPLTSLTGPDPDLSVLGGTQSGLGFKGAAQAKPWWRGSGGEAPPPQLAKYAMLQTDLTAYLPASQQYMDPEIFRQCVVLLFG